MKHVFLLTVIAIISTFALAQPPQVESNPSLIESAYENPVAVLNINTATEQDFSQMLVGVGAKKAKAIIALRNQVGQFNSVEQLLDVKGIGQAILDKNRHLLTI